MKLPEVPFVGVFHSNFSGGVGFFPSFVRMSGSHIFDWSTLTHAYGGMFHLKMLSYLILSYECTQW